MKSRGTQRTGRRNERFLYRPIVRSAFARQQGKRRQDVPEGYLRVLRIKASGVPVVPGTPRDGFFSAMGHFAPHVELFLTLCGGVGFGVFLEEVESGRFFGGELSGFRNFLDRSGNGHFR
jgi:hypothetical protein